LKTGGFEDFAQRPTNVVVVVGDQQPPRDCSRHPDPHASLASLDRRFWPEFRPTIQKSMQHWRRIRNSAEAKLISG
jgi:hypothetical protein